MNSVESRGSGFLYGADVDFNCHVFLGSSLLVKVSVKKNLFVRFGRVFFASWKKRHLSLPLLMDGITSKVPSF